jgi:hypothetical protein
MAEAQEVWITDKKEVFVKATIVSQTSKEFTVSTDGEQKTVQIAKTFPVNPPTQDGVDDNTSLMFLHEPGLLDNIKTRYAHDQIYTYTGSILIAMNPFQRLDIYSEDIMFSYLGKSMGVMPPHIYAIADQAIRNMKATGQGQAIIVSGLALLCSSAPACDPPWHKYARACSAYHMPRTPGESGAGKSETAKVALQYLTTMCGNDSSGSGEEVRAEALARPASSTVWHGCHARLPRRRWRPNCSSPTRSSRRLATPRFATFFSAPAAALCASGVTPSARMLAAVEVGG